MLPERPFRNARAFAEELTRLRSARKFLKENRKKSGAKRQTLSSETRAEILKKTASRCHICGGEIEGRGWHADHILAHSKGGGNNEDNFLPACATCNNYRWDYESQEFRWILKLGVWLRTEIERGSSIGKDAAAQFVVYESRRIGRRKSGNTK